MFTFWLRFHTLTLLLAFMLTEATDTAENGTLIAAREPRVTGRIVKVYSGPRPEPILCTGEGFQADPRDCSIFYRCTDSGRGKFTVYKFSCGPGTVYDPETEICNHPKSTKRSECGGSLLAPNINEHENINEVDDVQDVPSPITTNKPIYFIQSTIATTSTTKPPTVQHDLVTTSSETIKFDIAQGTTTKPIVFGQHQSESNSDIAPSITQTESYHVNNDNICKTDGFMGDTENCRKFYRCVANQNGGYTRHEFFCSESTVWDDDSQGCNHAWAVKRSKCGRHHIHQNKLTESSVVFTTEAVITTGNHTTINKKETDHTVQQQLQISYGSKVTQTQTQISNGPVVQNQTQIHYDEKKEQFETSVKQNQTQISHNSAVSQTQTQINYGNKGIQTQLQIDHSGQSSQSQTQVHETSTNNVISTSTTKTNVNDKVCTQSGFVGDKNDCRKFYRCVDNGRGHYTKYEFSCSDGTVWDPEIEACNHAWAVKNCGGSVLQSDTTTEIVSSASSMQPIQQTTTFHPISTHETTYSTKNDYSTNAVATNIEEDEDNGYGNSNMHSTIATTIAVKTTPESAAVLGTKCSSSGFMGSEIDCKVFYRCVDNGDGTFIKYEFKCGEGTVWDPKIEACNHAWAVEKCGKGETSSVQPEVTSELAPTSEVIQSSTVLPVNNHETDAEVHATTESVVTNTVSFKENECSHSGFMGDQKDCKKFYRCVDNGNGSFIRYEFSCGEGTLWDPKIEACNHAWAVEKCGAIMPTTESSSTTPVYAVTENDENDNGYNSNGQTQEIHHSTVSTEIQPVTEKEETDMNNSDKDIVCKSSGFIGDKNNCKKFYRCVDDGKGGYTRHEFNCGEGTVWDQSIEACNHAWEVNNCGYGETTSTTSQINATESTAASSETTDHGYGQSTDKISTTEMHQGTSTCTEEGYLADKMDCKKFYRCASDGQGSYIKYEFICGDGTYWNQEILSCDHENSEKLCTGTNHDNTTNTPPLEKDEMITASTITPNYTTEKSDEGFTTQKHDTTGKCNSEGFYGDNFDCKKFYRCVDNNKGGYTRYDFTCGEGTIWDQDIQACNHESPENKCTPLESTTSSQPISTSSSYTIETENHTEKTETTASLANNVCTSEGFFAVEDDCQKFVRCVTDGKGGFTKYEFTCGEGTVWVQDIQACDHNDGYSNCSSKPLATSSTTKPEDSYITHTTSQTPTTNAPSQTDSIDNPELQENNSNSGTNNPNRNVTCKSDGFYGYENDCKRFYRCVANGDGSFTKYDFTCGEGTGWDQEIEACNHLNQVKACENSNQESVTTLQPVMHDESTENPTDVSSASTSKTTTSSQSSSNTENKDECTEEGYFGDTKDCKKFYRCVDNGKGGYTKYDFACGEGTIWDQDITTCNHPEDVTNASCKESQSGSTSGTTTTTEKSSSSGSNSTESTSQSPSSGTSESNSQSPSNCSKEETSTSTVVADVNCTKAGFFPNPNDCKKFYRCVDWDGDGKRFSVYHFECGEGTIWDPSVETCNHEESVYPPRNCNGTQSQVENVNQETTTADSTTTENGENTTTQSSTTQTTQESTTDGTTTQETTTHESATTESTTTTAQTTTQQSTSEPTTTEKTDQTTSEQPTTTEQTTTQEATTMQQTTQASTTQSTTSEGTTTEQSTTQEPTTTTEQSTIKTTTEESTTTEQTTTQQSSTTEQSPTSTEQVKTSTEPSTTTTEQSTTTTEQSTTTTEHSTTTTEQSTTEQSTTTTEQGTAATDQSTTTTEQSTTTTAQSHTDETTSESETQSTTEQSTTSTTTEENSSHGECPDTDDDQYLFVCPTSFRRHPKYCNMFYQCTEDDSHDVKIATFTCPNNTIYDESKTKCVEENQADKKCEGEIAQRRRFKRIDKDYKEPIIASTQSYACPSPGYYPFENTECSPAFLKCEKSKSKKLRGYVYQCPSGYIYWSISKRCERVQQVARCERSGNNWSGRWEIPTERRNIAA